MVGGIAVHIGARIAALAGPGEILVSGTVRDAVQGAGFEFEDRGEQELKGIAGAWHVHALIRIPDGLMDELLSDPPAARQVSGRALASVGIVGIALAVGILVLRSSDDRSEASDPLTIGATGESSEPLIERSIAVLPFETRSANEEDLYFARGMHDDILTQLAQIDSLKVISRTSVERYADTETPLRQIGEELGVATILEGAIQRSGDRIRLTVQLIDAREDEHLWAASYDEELTAEKLFAIQSALARRIAGSLRAQLRSEAETRVGARPTESVEAYLHWARGKYLQANDSLSPSVLEASAREFHLAIQADSSYALPWAELARNEFLRWFFLGHPPEEAFPAARAFVDRSLALDPRLAFAHMINGLIFEGQWRFEEAEAEHLRAIDLAPGSASAHIWYADHLFSLARFEEAEAEYRRALELDPVNADLIQSLGWVRWAQRDWDGAIRYANHALEIDPNYHDAWNLLGNALGRKGDHAAAFKAIESGRKRNPTGFHWTVAMANAQARAGNRQEALRWLDRVPPDASGYLLLWVASVHGTLGDADKAFAILDVLIETDPYILLYIGFDRDYDPLRNDPRFQDVRRRAREAVERRNRG